MNLKFIYARRCISARTRTLFKSILCFFTGLVLFSQLALFSIPARAIEFSTNTVRPIDILNYEFLGYTYDTLESQDSNPSLQVRKNAVNLSSEEIGRFVNALTILKSTQTTARDGTSISIYDQFVATHLGTTDVAGRIAPDNRRFSNPAHGNAAFLPWHRYFLYEFEKLLQVVDPTVTIPYWDFTDRNATQNIIFKENFLGPNGGTGGIGGGVVQVGPFSVNNGWLQRKDLSGNTWTGRSTDTQPMTRYLRSLDRLPTTTQVNQALAQTTYDNFRSNLESTAHAGAHLWVGGSTGYVGTSPNDPIFWMLHTNIDRLWAQWQLNGHWGNSWYPASGKPLGHNLNDVMWPWDGGRMNAAADLQAFIPGLPSTQAQVRRSLRSVEFKVASSPEELMSDRTGHLYNPFFDDGHQNMADQMLHEDGIHHASDNPSSWTS